jgi:hypothetical protein
MINKRWRAIAIAVQGEMSPEFRGFLRRPGKTLSVDHIKQLHKNHGGTDYVVSRTTHLGSLCPEAACETGAVTESRSVRVQMIISETLPETTPSDLLIVGQGLLID